MFKISQTQIQAFEKAATERFINALASHLRLIFNDKFKNYTKNELLEFAWCCYDEANIYGIDTEYDVRRFAEFVAIYGRRMTEDNLWIGQTLKRDDISGKDKMDILDNLEVQFVGASL
jgi:hypothetical protein